MLRSYKTIVLLLPCTLLLAGGCRNPIPCPDCTDNAEDGDPPEGEDPTPDLPCGGADLLTDNDNCGTCGNVCPTLHTGTEWEAGTCTNGVCGPLWTSSCVNGSGAFNTCAELCSSGGQTCIAGGCAGLTALLQQVGFDGVCQLPPEGVMTGSCFTI